MIRRHLPRLVASLLIGGGFLWMLQRGGLPLLPEHPLPTTARWGAVAAFVVFTLLMWGLRTYRWVHLLRPVAEIDPRRVTGVSMVGSAAVFFAPLRMGELVRPYLISQGGPPTFAQATGSVAAERIIDGLVLSLLLFAGLRLSTPLSPLPDHLGKLPIPVAAIPAAAYGALTLFTCAFIAMGLFYWRRALARRLTQATVGVVSPRLAGWLAQRVERLAEGLSFLPSLRHMLPFLRDTLLYWACNALSMWALLRVVGIDASPLQGAVLMGVLGVGMLVPAGPGFFGAFQISSYSALAMYFPESVVLDQGATYVFLLYLSNLVCSLAALVVGFWLERLGSAARAPSA